MTKAVPGTGEESPAMSWEANGMEIILWLAVDSKGPHSKDHTTKPHAVPY